MNLLITGTSSGIGNGLAKAAVRNKWNIWGISRRTPNDLVGYSGYNHLSMDMTDGAGLRQTVPPWIGRVPMFDMVILNAGVLGPIRWATEQSTDEMKHVMDVNVWGNKELLDILFKSEIAIEQVVGMSTGASLRSSPGWGAYSLSKAALNMLMEVYAKEHETTHFSAFAPGLVDSEIQEYIWTITETDKYPAAKLLQEKRYTHEMPDSNTAATRLLNGMIRAREYPSGTFVDVREMDLTESSDRETSGMKR